MAFTRDEIKTYEAATPEVVADPIDTSPPVKVELETEPVVAESSTEPSDNGNNDGSITETTVESVTTTDVSPEDENTPELETTNTNDGKSRSRAQERIEELVAERNALRKYGEYLLKQVEGTRSTTTKVEQESQPVKEEPKEEVAPTLEDAGYDPVKLSQMQSEFMKKQIKKGIEEAVNGLKVQQSATAIQQSFESRAAEFRKDNKDFDLVLSNPELPRLHEVTVAAVFRSENGPAIAYHLAKNPDQATRIARMDPYAQAVAIGRLEEQLARTKTETKDMTVTKEPSKETAPVKVAPKQVSGTKAPPPPKPVSGGSAPISKDLGIMSMEEFVQHERSRKLQSKQERMKMRTAFR
jgi:hypothetical protein